jgi:reversibly glycosylated polypeptide/UDP-arabinopyranose mutase
MKTISVVTPSHRPEMTKLFLEAWKTLFEKHDVDFVLVDDSRENPYILHDGQEIQLETDLVQNHCASVRQLGFLYVAQFLPDIKYIITLDYDTYPIGDPIQDHIDALNMRVPLTWISTASDYMRGFPYGVRTEAPVMLSHGVWEGVYDWDAPSQLLKGDTKVSFYKGPIPKGVFFPMCGMNLAFKREALPYVYFAPVGNFKGAERFDDIWAGVNIVNDFAKLNWGIVSGYAKIQHLRASNVFQNLEKEATGIKHHEEFYKDLENYKGDKWFDEFRSKAIKWFELTK